MGLITKNSFWGREIQTLRQRNIERFKELFKNAILPIWDLLQDYRKYAQRMEKEMLAIQQNGTGGVNEGRLKELNEKLPKCKEVTEYTEKVLAKQLISLFLNAEKTQRMVEAAVAVVVSKLQENRGQGPNGADIDNSSP